MATVQHYIDQMPNIFVQRYGPNRWIAWLNDLLEELSGKGVLPLTLFEKGIVPQHSFWVDKPNNLKSVRGIVSPYSGKAYNYTEANNRIKLEEAFTPSVAATSSSLGGFTTESVTVDVADVTDNYDAGYFKDHLLVVTSGTGKGKTFLIADSSESSGGETVLTFLHPLSSAWAGTEATAVSLYSKKNYLMMSYVGAYSDVSGVSDDVGIDAKYDRVVTVYLRYRAERFTSSVSNETVVWKDNYRETLLSLFGERLNSFGGPAKGRYLAGHNLRRR